MARTLAILACLLAASALLGNTLARAPESDATLRAADGDDEGEPVPMSETTFADGSALVAASAPLPGSPAMAGAGVDGSLEVDVPAGATAIVVELAYTGLGPGFVLYVGDPADAWTEVHPDAASPGLQQLRVDGPEAGPWSALGFAESVAANAEFTLAFTVFYGEVPDGFSAFA